jgi:hypothetical protein
LRKEYSRKCEEQSNLQPSLSANLPSGREIERKRETECTDLHTGFYAWFKFALIGKKGLAKEGFSNRNPRCAVSLQFSLGKGIRKCT